MARRSKTIKTIAAECIYENDTFDCNLASGRSITHKMNIFEELEKENLELKRIRGNKNKTIIIFNKNETIEFKNLCQAANFLDIYTWEAEQLLENGDEYNGYYLDIK